jgi:ribosomal protein L16 Arg81 hydroxylase
MDKYTIQEILDPISVNVFFKEYWQKKHLVIRRNKYKGLFTFNMLGDYLNQYPDVKSLQILDYDDNDTRWCLDKVKKKKIDQPMLSKQQVFDLWKKGKSLVIPFAEYQKKALVDICFELERYFSHGQVNVYASPKADSKSFPAHQDGTENFLFHTEGKVKWTLYKDFDNKEVLDQFTLEAGDLLYIPIGIYHKVETVGPRILLSIHFKNKKNQTLDNFKITSNNENNRRKWYNWLPEFEKKIKRAPQRLMNKPRWSKPYFNKKI